jgi:MoxR-like ATPase
MTESTDINAEFKLASEYVLNTSKNIFLTGKAGTGKTTFLRYIKQQTRKNTVIVAPTGVAAINAGGVTMHSFFQLPFIPFVPQAGSGFQVNDFLDRNTLFNTVRFNKNKIELFRELDLLVIDEVSMLRSDMLDCIDTILRHFIEEVFIIDVVILSHN